MKLISILKQVIVEANVIPWWAVTPTGLERFNRKLKKIKGIIIYDILQIKIETKSFILISLKNL